MKTFTSKSTKKYLDKFVFAILTHPASYPLTLSGKMSHGEAVGAVLPECIKKLHAHTRKS